MGVHSACSGAAVIIAATTAVVVDIFMLHPEQRVGQIFRRVFGDFSLKSPKLDNKRTGNLLITVNVFWLSQV
ncbi:hypothetical protein [Pantoea sp. WMus005]|uniref:hypothetical protein n=1 Tax=Pantoea sp. WMus005 TaxID=2750734 RepID=UPI0015CFA287|nr:hypothetical protein [Pantoea sp. WMus005]NYS30827.1 hypothetical protein [Pantoea sp. WMus005]